MSLKPVSPEQIAHDKISAMLSARGLDPKHAAAFIERNDAKLSVKDGRVLFGGIDIDRAVTYESNFFGNVPRTLMKLTARQLAEQRAAGIKHPYDSVEIVDDPDDKPAAGSTPAASLKDRALLKIRSEFRARGLPDDAETARSFLNMNSDRLNFVGDVLRIGNRPLAVELTITPSLTADIATPRIRMTLAEFTQAQRNKVKLPMEQIEIEG